ncbi:MAG: hypothetical protein LBL90_13190, partial [Prevotellaceae bacterium]|jgi:hypothetical protein|nr:hypothetical protein [Prevotellaceae bacterium]MDR1056737.1 hypothetical protein [Prevotellaceae bacterium]
LNLTLLFVRKAVAKNDFNCLIRVSSSCQDSVLHTCRIRICSQNPLAEKNAKLQVFKSNRKIKLRL